MASETSEESKRKGRECRGGERTKRRGQREMNRENIMMKAERQEDMREWVSSLWKGEICNGKIKAFMLTAIFLEYN